MKRYYIRYDCLVRLPCDYEEGFVQSIGVCRNRSGDLSLRAYPNWSEKSWRLWTTASLKTARERRRLARKTFDMPFDIYFVGTNEKAETVWKPD